MSAIYRNRFTSYVVWRFILKQPRLRRLITALVTSNRTESISLLGADIYINRRQEMGYWRASKQQYGNVVFRDEVPSLIRIAQLSAGASSFIDCGANVGLFCAVLFPLRLARPEMQFYAFEPNPETFGRLVQALGGKGVHVENVALSNNDGHLEMVGGATSGVFGVEGGSFQCGPVSKVPSRRLDSYTFEGDRLFLKIDVEGHELEVLEGAGRLFDQGKIAGVFIDGARKERECVDFLRRHRLVVLNGHSLEPYQPGGFRMLGLRAKQLEAG